MANTPARGSWFIAAIKKALNSQGEVQPTAIYADEDYDPPRLIVELPDRTLRVLGVVTIGAGSSAIGTVRSPVVSQATSNGTPVASATSTTAVAAPSANNHLRIHRLHASNGGATATWIWWLDGSGGTQYFGSYLMQGATVSLKIDGGWDLTGGGTPKALVLKTSAAGSVEWNASYETVAD